MFSIHSGRMVAVCSVLGVSLAFAACTDMSPDEGSGEAAAAGEQTGETTQALSGAHKMCSAVVDGNFRDTIIVGAYWHPYTCAGWAQSVGAPIWQLGCVDDWGFSWGAAYGYYPPNNNCNWQW